MKTKWFRIRNVTVVHQKYKPVIRKLLLNLYVHFIIIIVSQIVRAVDDTVHDNKPKSPTVSK